MPEIRITVDGKLALTVEQAAERYGLQPSSMRGELTRLKAVIAPVDHLDGRKPLYLAATLDRVMGNRPGRGAPGVPRSAPDSRSTQIRP
jgi:hypothetical protein